MFYFVIFLKNIASKKSIIIKKINAIYILISLKN
jgi:hypothetical protein